VIRAGKLARQRDACWQILLASVMRAGKFELASVILPAKRPIWPA
jgi:hypothetical protein